MSLFQEGDIAHYYGDYVRQLFILAAVLLAVSIPISGTLIPLGIYVQITVVVILVVLAGLINPDSPRMMTASTIVAGLGVILFGTAAITSYQNSAWMLFWTQEVIAVVFLFSLYYSVKTTRAMAQHKLHLKTPPRTHEPTEEDIDR